MSNHIRNILMADFESEGAVKAFMAKVKGAEHDFQFQAYTPMPRTLLIPEPCNDEFIYAVVKDYGLKLDQYPENMKKAVKQCFWPFKEEKDVTYGDLYSAYGRAEKRRVHLPDETEDSKPCDSKENVLGEDYFIRIKADFDAVGAYALQNVRRYGHPGWYSWRLANWGCKWDAWDVRIESISSKKLRIDFTTANSTPTQALMALSKLFPTVLFDNQYADEDIGYNCGWAKYLNGEVTEEDTPLGGNDSIDFACDVWGYDPEEYRQEQEED